MPTKVVDALGSCATGLCVRFTLAAADRERPVFADVAPTESSHTLGRTDQPVSPESSHTLRHTDQAVSPTSSRTLGHTDKPVSPESSRTLGHTDQPVNLQGTHLQMHPGCDTCRSNEAKGQIGQDAEEDAAEEDAISTTGSFCQGHPRDVGSAHSEDSWTAGASPESTFASAAVSEHVEIDADSAAAHQAMEAEELHQPGAGRVCNSFELEPNEWCSTHRQPAVCGSFKPQPDEKPPCQGEPVVCGSFKLGSDSTSSVSDQPRAFAAIEIAAAAATAAEPRDAGAAAGQADITWAALEKTAEQAAVDLPAAVTELAAAESAAAEATTKPVAAQTAAAQSESVSARIVGRSGKFYTMEMGAANQRVGDFAPWQCLTRRFQEFVTLDMDVRPRHPALPKLPQKSVFFRKTFKRGFMDDREQQLGAYLSALVADPEALAEPSVRKFLGFAC